jgi:hypothetical protein
MTLTKSIVICAIIGASVAGYYIWGMVNAIAGLAH